MTPASAMNTRFKVVAVSLLLGLLISPAVAMAGCWTQGSANALQPCEPHCPKMAAMVESMAEAIPSSIGATAPMLSCCSVTPSRPEPISQVTAPNESSAFVMHSVHFAAKPVARPATILSNAAPPPTHTPSRTLLCTFLI